MSAHEQKMKRFLYLFCLLSFCSTFAFAADFEGLLPGVSKKAEVDRVLGKPLIEVVKGERYDFAPKKYDARRISIKFNRETQTIETIDLYFKVNYDKSKFKKWFNLGNPSQTTMDNRGNLVEIYLPQGIVLHFDGPDDSYLVEFFSHIDPALIRKEKVATQERVSGQGKIPFLGVTLIRHEGQGIQILAVHSNSAAQGAGLRSGDVILQLENHKFYGRKIDLKEFTSLILKMPVNRPLAFLIEREGQRFETRISLEERDKEELAAMSRRDKELAHESYREGEKRIDARDYRSAIEYFKRAIQYNPSESQYYILLAYAAYEIGETALAIQEFKRAIMLKPQYFPYYGLGMIYWENKQYDKAIDPLKEAVRLRPPDLKDTAVYGLLGSSYLRKGRVREALDTFGEAHKIDPQSPVHIYFIAVCYDQMGNRNEAISFYKQYLSLENNEPTMNNLAQQRLLDLTRGSQRDFDFTDNLLKTIEILQRGLKK